ncbi:MAG: hypothetical protein MUQ32_04910, partial [Chloroflexi bacterium]|nr:hypothetical protein [Chloroflexota bacterium]
MIVPLLAAVTTETPSVAGGADPIAALPVLVMLVSMAARALASAGADRQSARSMPRPRDVDERLRRHHVVADWGRAWFAALGATGTDRPAAEGAAGDLYRLAGRAPPILVWVRSSREMAIVRPLIEIFLDGLGSGRSPADAWFTAVSEHRPTHEGAVWRDAVAQAKAQVRDQIGAAERRTCSSVQADLLAPLDRDAGVVRVRQDLTGAWSTSRAVRSARVVAYQLAREGWNRSS